MKTLNEVIAEMEDEGLFADALQWLKGYKAHIELDKLRDKYGVTSQITCPKCHSEFVILPDANNPLAWEQLKQMEGKPVWIEDKDCYGRWEIITGVYDDGISFGDYFLSKDEFSKTWQAYRKERE